jgi:UDP-galactopyranose mutase
MAAHGAAARPGRGATAAGGGFVMRHYDYLIVGAGFAGSVMAERLAAGLRRRVLVIDQRPHVGGNAFDRLNEDGLRIQTYGPHIFHTNSCGIFEYLSRFTAWRPYEHRVCASVDGRLVPLPINLTTVNRVYGWTLSSEELEIYLARVAEPRPVIRSAEDVVVSRIGRDLYERIYRNYSRKQWGVDLCELDPLVTARLPIRTGTDDRYFGDAFQVMPADGYTRMFERLLAHPLIDVELGACYEQVRACTSFRRLIYTGPIDEFFGWRLGRLPYRSLTFRHETLNTEQHQPVAVVNYPGREEYTRVTEFKHLTGQRHQATTIAYEFPSAAGDPYYPIPSTASHALYRQYRVLAARVPGVHFLGRLGSYRYYNMDQVVGQALAAFRRLQAVSGPEFDPDAAMAAAS